MTPAPRALANRQGPPLRLQASDDPIHSRKNFMTKRFTLRATLVVAAAFALPWAHAAVTTKADYDAGKARIEADFGTAKAACAGLAGNRNDICLEQAKGKEKVARAELEFAHTAKPADGAKVAVARADADYAVARERCDDTAGNVKDVCVQEAKAAQTKAMANAKLGEEVGASNRDANDAARDADYKVATEKCDALAGDARTSCVAAAKAKFGKT